MKHEISRNVWNFWCLYSAAHARFCSDQTYRTGNWIWLPTQNNNRNENDIYRRCCLCVVQKPESCDKAEIARKLSFLGVSPKASSHFSSFSPVVTAAGGFGLSVSPKWEVNRPHNGEDERRDGTKCRKVADARTISQRKEGRKEGRTRSKSFSAKS